jgi:hypothetical protein
VVYWPQDATWDDDALPAIRRNRVTFMRQVFEQSALRLLVLMIPRYLTKITHQVVALVSHEHAGRIVWKDDPHDKVVNDEDEADDEDNRFFAFEVAKTKEETEDARGSAGFSVCYRSWLT